MAETQLTSPIKKTNKYLKSENRWQPPVKNVPTENNKEENSTTRDVPIMNAPADTVHKFQAPEMHHAEVVTLRQNFQDHYHLHSTIL